MSFDFVAGAVVAFRIERAANRIERAAMAAFLRRGRGALLWFALPFLISRLRAWFGGGPRG